MNKKRTINCAECGKEIKGKIGQTVKCKNCGAVHHIE